MSGGINLHDVVRSAITTVHPDETVALYFNAGQVNNWGEVTPIYEGPYSVQAQIQSESDAALFHSNNAGMNTETIKAYFYQSEDSPIAELSRFKERGGDMFQRSDGSWWLITALPDNFSSVGWISARATLQVNGPQNIQPPPSPPSPPSEDEEGDGNE